MRSVTELSGAGSLFHHADSLDGPWVLRFTLQVTLEPWSRLSK